MNQDSLHCFELELDLVAPLMFSGGAQRRFGEDVSQIRDQQGRPIIPDTHLKGVLRHAWAYLASAGLKLPLSETEAFGQESVSHQQHRARFMFDDLVADLPRGTAMTTRVSIDDETGAAAEGHLLTVEEVAPPGTTVTFRGVIRAVLPPEVSVPEVEQAIELALEAVGALGRFKTVGYGTLSSARLQRAGPLGGGMRPSSAPGAIEFDYRFSLHKSLLVDVLRLDANTLVGSDTIPGGVLKGALAEKLRALGSDPEAPPLADALSAMIIGHARIEGGDDDGPGVNLSFVKYRRVTSRWAPNLTLGDLSEDLPAFEPDWKDEPPEPFDRDVRTRVSIDAESGASKLGALFTQSAIWPMKGATPLVWRSRIVWPLGADHPGYSEFLRCLDVLQDGLWSVGKLDAMTVDASATEAAAPKPLGASTHYEVELCTPCLMIREFHLESEAVYAAALNRYWREVSGGALEIAEEPDAPIENPEAALDFYCHQEMRGDHLALRFRHFGDDVVEPFVLAMAGSVFRLRARDPEEGRAVLEGFCRTGLPVAIWTGDQNGGPDRVEFASEPHYAECPFGPQQGFGRIEVRLPEETQ